jgi:predicted Zn-dependent protease
MVDPENLISPINAGVVQIEAELALVQNDPQQALEIVDPFIDAVIAKGMAIWVPEKLLLNGKALLQMGESEQAHQILSSAYDEAENQKARRILWQICALLADVETERGRKAEAASLRQRAKEIVEYIADHAGRDDLKATFLVLPEVKAILHTGVPDKA